MDDAARRLASCFTLVFPGLPADQIPSARQDAVESWDSLAHINLVTVIDEEFGISTDIEDAEGLTTFPALLDHVRGKTPAT